jgi:hypothetical protein
MKKIKVVLMTAAVLTAAIGVFATRPCDHCELAPQYIPSGQGYVEAGQYGVDYICYTTAGVCTYYKPDYFKPIYAPCRVGNFEPVE